MAAYEWSTSSIFPPGHKAGSGTGQTIQAPALIILNQPIPITPSPKSYFEIFDILWRSSGTRLCADGGANRLWEYLGIIGRAEEDEAYQEYKRGGDIEVHGGEQEDLQAGGKGCARTHRLRYLPNSIIGDLDSLLPMVSDWYSSKGVKVQKDPSQYSTDLQKCISEVEDGENKDQDPTPIIILGGLSGRLDQTTHLLHLLHKLRFQPNLASSVPKTPFERLQHLVTTTGGAIIRKPDQLVDGTASGGEKLKGDSDEPWWKPKRGSGTRDIRVVSENCIAWVLDTGEHHIHIDHDRFGQTCGILPLGVEESQVRTEGLKWDVDWTTSFSTVVSTSNHLLPEVEVVKIWTSRPVWWTMEIKV